MTTAEKGACPTCGPTAIEQHPRRFGVTRCANCKEWISDREYVIYEAEQRGREDNADHSQCYVSGSKALEARLAEAWDLGYSCGLGDHNKDASTETVAANPYRVTHLERGE